MYTTQYAQYPYRESALTLYRGMGKSARIFVTINELNY